MCSAALRGVIFILQRLCSPTIPTRPSLSVTPAPRPQHLGPGSVSRCGRFAGRYSEPFRRSQGSEGQSQQSVQPASPGSAGAGEGRRDVSLAAALGRPLAFVLGSAPRPTRVCSALWRLRDVPFPTTWLELRSAVCCYSHFTVKKTEAQRSCHLFEVKPTEIRSSSRHFARRVCG